MACLLRRAVVFEPCGYTAARTHLAPRAPRCQTRALLDARCFEEGEHHIPCALSQHSRDRLLGDECPDRGDSNSHAHPAHCPNNAYEPRVTLPGYRNPLAPAQIDTSETSTIPPPAPVALILHIIAFQYYVRWAPWSIDRDGGQRYFVLDAERVIDEGVRRAGEPFAKSHNQWSSRGNLSRVITEHEQALRNRMVSIDDLESGRSI